MTKSDNGKSAEASHRAQTSSLAAPPSLIQYPAGALLRVKDICGDRAAGRPGILPIVPRTWLKWVEAGKVPQGVLLGAKTRAWRIETVLAACDSLSAGDAAAPAAKQ